MMPAGGPTMARRRNMSSKLCRTVLYLTNAVVVVLGISVLGFGAYIKDYLASLEIPEKIYKIIFPLATIMKFSEALIGTGLCICAVAGMGITGTFFEVSILLILCCVGVVPLIFLEAAMAYVFNNMDRLTTVVTTKIKETTKAISEGPRSEEVTEEFRNMFERESVKITMFMEGPMPKLSKAGIGISVIFIVVEIILMYFACQLIRNLRRRKLNIFAREGQPVMVQNVNNNNNVPASVPSSSAPSPAPIYRAATGPVEIPLQPVVSAPLTQPGYAPPPYPTYTLLPPSPMPPYPSALSQPPPFSTQSPLIAQPPPLGTQSPILVALHPQVTTQSPNLVAQHPQLATQYPNLAGQPPPVATQSPNLAAQPPPVAPGYIQTRPTNTFSPSAPQLSPVQPSPGAQHPPYSTSPHH